MKKRESGFTLIELLIVIAIIGILAAIAIPNLLNAVQRGKQKRTMSDMRALATAIEAYAVDNNQFPAAGLRGGRLHDDHRDAGDRLVLEPLADLHRPGPAKDGWSDLFPVRVNVANRQLRDRVGRPQQDGRRGVLRHDDQLQRRHLLLERHVRPVAGGHAVLGVGPRSRSPSGPAARGRFSWPGASPLQWSRADSPSARLGSLRGRGLLPAVHLARSRADARTGADAARPGRLLFSPQALHRGPPAFRRDPALEPAFGRRRAVARQRPGGRLLPAHAALPPAFRGPGGRALPAAALRDRRLGGAALSQGGERLGCGGALRSGDLRGLRLHGLVRRLLEPFRRLRVPARDRGAGAVGPADARLRSGARCARGTAGDGRQPRDVGGLGHPRRRRSPRSRATRSPSRSLRSRDGRALRRCAAGVGLGLALAAWVLVPMAELAGHSDRRAALAAEQRNLGAVGPADALSLAGFSPPFFGGAYLASLFLPPFRSRRGGGGLR